MKKLLFLCFLAFGFSLFAQPVISPEPGTWSNRQMLVIDNTGESDFFYSIDGSDPYQFGLAYDGPVLIDLTGDVKLRICKNNYDGTSENIEVNYRVEEDFGNAETSAFLQSFMSTGVLNYLAGAELNVPESMEYALGDKNPVFLKGRTISYSEECPLSRYLTVRLRENGKNWKFLMKTNPRASGIFSRVDVPFSVEDWNYITFENQDFIYKIDDGYWELPKDKVYLDRSEPHMIYWQSIAYEKGNPVEFFELPVKPQINVIKAENDSLKIYFEEENSYSMCPDNSIYQELFTSVTIDTFYGDEYKGVANLKIFSDSVYQGIISVPYSIDKCPPQKPVFVSSAQGFYSRESVEVDISTDPKAKLYIQISDPFAIEDRSNVFDPENEMFDNVSMSDVFQKSGSTKLILKPSEDNATYLKVIAWSSDGKNQSEVAEYAVVIDRYNYYVNASSDSSISEGTAEHPFSSLEQCMQAVNKNRYARIFVSGRLEMKEGITELLSNCVIEGIDDGVIVFPSESNLVVKASSLTVKNIKFEADSSMSRKKNMLSLIKLENAVLFLENCDFSVSLGINGTVFNSNLSVITLLNCAVSLTSHSYGSVISANKSKVFVNDSFLNAVSNTAVCISCREGELTLENNSLSVSGEMGRIAEVFTTNGSMTKNRFNGDLANSTTTNPIYIDKNSNLQTISNVVQGF